MEQRKIISLRPSLSLLSAIDAAWPGSDCTSRHEWLIHAVESYLEDPPDAVFGDVERQTRRDVEALVTAHPMGEALAALAFSLARSLDNGAGMATAAVSRELRATLIELAKHERGSVDDSDDGPDLSATALGDAEDDDEANPW